MMTDQDEGPPPEFYTLPSLEDVEFWERYHAVGLNNPEPQPHATRNGDYTWIDLTDPSYSIPPAPPSIEGILYAGRRHVISGPPESTKTLVAYLLLLTALRQNEGVAILDFEMGPHAAVTLLRELGATDEELSYIHYTEPDGPPSSSDIERMLGLGVGYCLVDAAAGAYDVSGLDDNARKDAEQFASRWIRPLWQEGVATIVIDHVTKNADTRGKFTIGSERKTGQADVHLSLEAMKALNRGGDGVVKITVMKDRPGHLPRPTLYLVYLESDPDTNTITWDFHKPEPTPHTEDGQFEPTIYMGMVSKHMESYPEVAFSKNTLSKEVGKRADLVRKAVDLLHAKGHLAVTGKRGGHPIFTLVRPFVPTSSDFVPDEPAVTPSDFVPVRPPLTGGRDEVGGHSQATDDADFVPDRIDVTDPAIQAMFDEPEF